MNATTGLTLIWLLTSWLVPLIARDWVERCDWVHRFRNYINERSA